LPAEKASLKRVLMLDFMGSVQALMAFADAPNMAAL
jgi:hypothetical protein